MLPILQSFNPRAKKAIGSLLVEEQDGADAHAASADEEQFQDVEAMASTSVILTQVMQQKLWLSHGRNGERRFKRSTNPGGLVSPGSHRPHLPGPSG